jgi:hypothetical protein
VTSVDAGPSATLTVTPPPVGPKGDPLDDPTLVATTASKGSQGWGVAAGVVLVGLGLVAGATSLVKPKGAATPATSD